MFSLHFVYFFAVTVSYVCVETMTQVNIKFIIIDFKLFWLVNEHKGFMFYAIFPSNHQFVVAFASAVQRKFEFTAPY